MTKPPPTPNRPVRNPIAVPAPRSATTGASMPRRSASDALLLGREAPRASSRRSPTSVQVGQATNILQAAITISTLKANRSTLGSRCLLTVLPAIEPTTPLRPKTTPIASLTRPSLWCASMPTRAEIPTTNRLVVVALRALSPAAYTSAGTASTDPPAPKAPRAKPMRKPRGDEISARITRPAARRAILPPPTPRTRRVRRRRWRSHAGATPTRPPRIDCQPHRTPRSGVGDPALRSCR